MCAPGDMSKLEVERENVEDPSVHAGTGRDVGVLEHTFDVLGVDLDDEVPAANDPETQRPKGAIQSVELEFRLGESTFAAVKRD